MYYFNARYYDPKCGVFICPDPAMSGANHYAYAGCNPIAYNDPTGMKAQEATVATSAVIVPSTTVSSTVFPNDGHEYYIDTPDGSHWRSLNGEWQRYDDGKTNRTGNNGTWVGGTPDFGNGNGAGSLGPASGDRHIASGGCPGVEGGGSTPGTTVSGGNTNPDENTVTKTVKTIAEKAGGGGPAGVEGGGGDGNKKYILSQRDNPSLQTACPYVAMYDAYILAGLIPKINMDKVIDELAGGGNFDDVMNTIFGTGFDTLNKIPKKWINMSYKAFKKKGIGVAIIEYKDTDLYGYQPPTTTFPNHTIGFYNGMFIDPWTGDTYNSIGEMSEHIWGGKGNKYCTFEKYLQIRYF